MEIAKEIHEKPKRVVLNDVNNNNRIHNEDSNETSIRAGHDSHNLPETNLENGTVSDQKEDGQLGSEVSSTMLTIVVMKGESHHMTQQPVAKISKDVDSIKDELPHVASMKKGYILKATSSHEKWQCRVCQQEKEEGLIDLGCQCKGGIAKAHRSCINAWFGIKGSNQCEICRATAINVSAIEFNPIVETYWGSRFDLVYNSDELEWGSFGLWFSMLIGALLFFITS